jgi:hypothetical protein
MKNTKTLNHANSWPVEVGTIEYSTNQWRKLSLITIPMMKTAIKKQSLAKITTRELTKMNHARHHTSKTRCKYNKLLFKTLKRIVKTKGY